MKQDWNMPQSKILDLRAKFGRERHEGLPANSSLEMVSNFLYLVPRIQQEQTEMSQESARISSKQAVDSSTSPVSDLHERQGQQHRQHPQ